jgi:hypothetical protein
LSELSERASLLMAAYVEYLRWGAYMAAAIGAWRFMPLAIVRLVAAFTGNETRHKQCMEVLRLARRDAASIPSYVSATPADKPPRPRRSVSKPEALPGTATNSP